LSLLLEGRDSLLEALAGVLSPRSSWQEWAGEEGDEEERVVVAMAVTRGDLDLLANFACSLRRQGLWERRAGRVVVFGADEVRVRCFVCVWVDGSDGWMEERRVDACCIVIYICRSGKWSTTSTHTHTIHTHMYINLPISTYTNTRTGGGPRRPCIGVQGADAPGPRAAPAGFGAVSLCVSVCMWMWTDLIAYVRVVSA
jgi:hypothetical protein